MLVEEFSPLTVILIVSSGRSEEGKKERISQDSQSHINC